MMLRYCVGWGGVITFICTSSHIWCYVIVCRLALPHIYDATLHFLTYMMLRCTSSHTWCYATVCRLALSHRYDATLLYVVLHFLTYMMLRCTSSHTWCYAALPHIHDATLLYVVLHFLTDMMLRYCMSSCTSSQIWCYATVCRLALSHRYDATLLFVVLHFLTDMMLRYCMSSCTSAQKTIHTQNCSKEKNGPSLAGTQIIDRAWSSLKNDWWPQHVNATSKVAGHTLMSEDVKAMVNQWVRRQSLGPITPIAFLEELKRLLKQWGKKAYEVLLRSSLEQGKNQERQKTLSFFLKIPFRATAVYQAWT